MSPQRSYMPAAGRDIFLPAYDPIMRLFGFQQMLQPLLAQAELQPHHAVLDIGCGTGTLAIMIKQAHPDVEVTGLDPDPLALTRATRKAQRASVRVRFERGFADAIPHGDATFDRVFSSMMFHHVRRDEKAGVLADVRRVLKPGGRLEFLDFSGGAHHSLLAHMLHGRQVSASADARLLERMREAGLTDAKRTASRVTPFGAISSYQATRA